MQKFIYIFLLINVVVVVHQTIACELTDTHHGCKIENSQCICAYGCRSEFRYTTKKECTDALKGQRNDICTRGPCLNGGTCIQISFNPGYKCRCEGTKHFGPRCQRPCPKDFSPSSSLQTFPHECIEI